MFCIHKEGFLNKQGKRSFQGYKKRWFVLNQTTVKYYHTQDTSENNVLGVIDMARVVSISDSKNVKHGFQVLTNSRTYYISAKTAQEKDDWISAMEKSSLEAKRLSALSVGSTLVPEGVNKMEPVHEYSLVGAYKGSESHSSTSSATYDVVSPKSSSGESSSQGESIYETCNEASRPSQPISLSKSWKEPIKDGATDSSNEDVFVHENADVAGLKMGDIMSKLSMESLDSIESLDLSDNEYLEDTVDGEAYHVEVASDEILPKPHGKLYATEEIKRILEAGKIQVVDVDCKSIAEKYKFNFDKNTEYPAFDTLQKFLKVIE